MTYKAVLFIIVSIILSSFLVSSGQNETTTVEINLLSNQPAQIISIEVPDYIFLGNVTKGEETDKYQIYLNNSGNVDIRITPQLEEPYDEIFTNLFFQNRQSGNNSAIYKIGEYSFEILKPSTEGGKKSEYFWMWLDLTDFQQNIEQDRMGLTQDVIFTAMPQ